MSLTVYRRSSCSFCVYSHSPFRQHKTKDKHEIDRMTMTMVSSANSICFSGGVSSECPIEWPVFSLRGSMGVNIRQ